MSVADIDRWNPGLVREVFDAAMDRSRSAEEVNTGLRQLPALTTWDGESAEAAREALAESHGKWALHGMEAVAVATAADRAADEIQTVKDEIAAIRAEGAPYQIWLNPETNTLVPPDTTSYRPDIQAEFAAKLAELQARLTAVLAAAAAADADLARAITMAETAHEPGVGTPNGSPEQGRTLLRCQRPHRVIRQALAIGR